MIRTGKGFLLNVMKDGLQDRRSVRRDFELGGLRLEGQLRRSPSFKASTASSPGHPRWVPMAGGLDDRTWCDRMAEKVNMPVVGIVENMAYYQSAPGAECGRGWPASDRARRPKEAGE